MTGRNNRGGPSRQTSQDDDTRSQPLQYPPSNLPKLKGSGQDNNWLTWKSLILSFLQSIALDVYLSAPEVDYDEETDSVEKRLDGHVKTCLMLTSEESIHRALYGKKRAYQMWTELCTQFENQGVQSRCTLLYKFLETKRYNFNSLKEYVLSIRGTFEQLPISCLSSEVAAAIVLSNLREEDGLIRRFAEESCTTTNDNNEKVLNFQLVTQKLLQEAQTEEAEAARESSKGTAMVAFQGFQGQGQSRGSNFRGRWQPRRGGFRGRGRGGSNSRGGFNNSQFKSGVQSFPRCRHCERTNHAEKDCYWSDPEKRKQLKAAKAGEKRKNTEGPAHWELRSSKDKKPEGPGVAKTAKRGALESLIENRSLVCKIPLITNELKFYLDSGASDHMCSDIGYLFNYNTSVRQPIECAGDQVLFIEGHGELLTNPVKHNGLSRVCDVQHVPDLKSNLLSISKLTRSGLAVVFRDDQCGVYLKDDVDLSGEPLLKTHETNGTYKINLEVRENEQLRATQALKADVIKSEPWHERLGHLGKNHMGLIQKLVCGMDRVSQFDHKCSTCQRAKRTKSPFPKGGSRRATMLLEIIHSDVCEVTDKISYQGFKYFVTFIDDLTRYTYIGLLKNKSNVFEEFKQYKSLVERHTGNKIKYLRSDNGGEYVNERFRQFFRSEGMLNQHSVARNPQQNGVAERANRTLLEKVRAMLKYSGLDIKFWPLALNTAVYLKNISPTSAVNAMVPYEAWTGSKPDVSFLRVFGCLAHAHLDSGKKLTDRTKDYIFVGYDEERKAYKLMDPKTNAVTSHRYSDVTFDETIFPALGDSPVKRSMTGDVGPNALVIPGNSRVISGANSSGVLPGNSRVISGASSSGVTAHLRVIPSKINKTLNSKGDTPDDHDSDSDTSSESEHEAESGGNISDSDHDSNSDVGSESEYESESGSTTQKKGDSLWGYYTDTSLSGMFHDGSSTSNSAHDCDSDETISVGGAGENVDNSNLNTNESLSRKRKIVPPKHFDGFILYGFGEKDCEVKQRDMKNNENFHGSPRRAAWLASKAINALPDNYEQAVNSSESKEWLAAIRDELESFKSNNVWTLEPLPRGAHVVGCKWVFKRKTNSDGSPLYRARLVAKGYTQQYGVDYFDTFAPVVKKESLRILFSLAVNFNLKIAHLDVKTAFLHGDLSEKVYMKQPDAPNDFVIPGTDHLVCRLKKAVYGLKQAARRWYQKADNLLRKEGFKNTKQEPCIYIKTEPTVTVVALYVDDFYLFYNDEAQKASLLKALSAVVTIKDLGEARNCLGMVIERDMEKGTLRLHQEEYLDSVLKRFNMQDCYGKSIPLDEKSKMFDLEKGYQGRFEYQQLIGSLLYLSTNTRPDISYTVSFLSQFNCCYTSTHWDLAKNVLCYLKQHSTLALNFTRSSNPKLSLVGYSDADWAGNPMDYKSYTGYCFTLDGNLISWESRKQRTAAQSTTESETIALAEAVKESIYLRNLVNRLFACGKQRVRMFCDNKSVIQLSESDNYYRARSKHYGSKIQLFRDRLDDGSISLTHVKSQDNHADIFTKALAKIKHRGACDLLNLTSN